MKQSAFLLLVLFLASCSIQLKEKEYTFPEIGWTIKVPPEFKMLDSAGVATATSKGRHAIENTLDAPLDLSATKTLIAFTKDKLNTFSATITPFDPKIDGDWNEIIQALKNIMTETFETQMPDVKADTSSSIEKIDNLTFDVFYSKIKFPNGILLHSYLYSHLRKSYDLGITITYTDEKIGERLKKVLQTSKFE